MSKIVEMYNQCINSFTNYNSNNLLTKLKEYYKCNNKLYSFL